MDFVILESGKVPLTSDNTAKWGWAKFFGSGSDAELRAAAQEREKIEKAMITIEKLSADEKAWMQALHEEIAQRDHISRMEGAKREGLEEGEAMGIAKGRADLKGEVRSKLLALGKSDAEIAEVLGYFESA
jgi:predicted transposase/invertase (TIGR01784 family)